MSILELFCSVETFWHAFEPIWQRGQLDAGRRSLPFAMIAHHGGDFDDGYAAPI